MLLEVDYFVKQTLFHTFGIMVLFYRLLYMPTYQYK